MRECAARAMIAAVTPLPHVATTGWVKSTPDLWNSRERQREREEGAIILPTLISTPVIVQATPGILLFNVSTGHLAFLPKKEK